MGEAAGLKFYLVENEPFILYPMMAGYWNTAYNTITASSGVIITPVVVTRREDPALEALTAIFKDEPMKWRITLQTQRVPINSGKTYPVSAETEFRTTFDSTVDIGKKLRALLGKDVALQALISGLADYQTGKDSETPPVQDIKSHEMTVPHPQAGKIVCLDVSYNSDIDGLLSHGMNGYYATQELYFNRQITGKISLVIIGKGGVGAGPPEGQKMVINQRILEEELAPDVVIVADNGAEIKGHRSCLMAHSPVFQAMFQADMQEANTRRIEMPDVSEEGVRAFLAYLYHWDVSKADESCAVALELLKAGHKYDIRLLESDMRKLLMSKPAEWFEMEVTLRLYLFVYNLDADWEALKMKAVKVLKPCSPKLKSSPIYHQMYRENPEATMDLFEYSVSS